MSDAMVFPETWEEFEESYGFADREKVYTNGSRLIPSFRIKQWLDYCKDKKTSSNWHTGTPTEDGWYLLECSIGNSENTYFTTDYWSDTFGYWTVNGVIRWQKITPFVGSVQEKETEDDILDPVPKTINITGIDDRRYVEILDAYEFKDYWRYDLNIFDNHGDAISVYIPKNEPRSIQEKEIEK